MNSTNNCYVSDTDALIEQSIVRFINDTQNARDIKNEYRFIYQIEYSLHRGKEICVGLSAARDSQSAVRFKSQTGDQISFSYNEVRDLVKQIPLTDKHLYDKFKQFVDGEEKFETITISLTSYNGRRIGKLENRGVGFDMDKYMLKQLNLLISLIFYRLQLLKTMNFTKFNNDCLKLVATNYSVGNEMCNLLKTLFFRSNSNTPEAYYSREIIIYEIDELERDLNMKFHYG